MYTFLLVINVACALVMVGVILLQHGQGADMGTAFGRGSQGSLFGITGSANMLSRTTSVLATVFFTTALALSIVPREVGTSSVLEALNESVVEEEVVSEAEVPATESEVPVAEAEVPAAEAEVPAAAEIPAEEDN